MFEVAKTLTFDAGHTLEQHHGKCKRPHGHTYSVTVTVRSDTLQLSGSQKNMVLDFNDIMDVAKEMIKIYFDHQWLNDTLETDSPTAEFMAKWMFDYLLPKLPGLYSIELYETPTSKVIYRIS